MKKIVLALFISLMAAGVVFADDAPKTLDVGETVVTRYIWRGLDLLNHAPSFQPYVTWYAGNSGFSANAWFSWALSKRDEVPVRHDDEIDLSTTYTKTFGAVQTTIGLYYVNFYKQYGYPNNGNTYYEGIFGAGLPNIPLSPVLTWNHSLNPDAIGEYVTLGLTQLQNVNGLPSPLVINATGGYSTQGWFVDDMGNQKRGFSDLNISVSEDLPWKNVIVTPAVNLNYTPNKNSRHDQTAFVGSLAVKKSW